MKRYVEVLDDKTALLHRSLDIFMESLKSAIAERDQFTVALAGGGTPKPLYEMIANQSLPWEKIHIFWGDERYVPPDHPDSNQRMAREAWLNRVAIPPENIHPMPTDAPEPAEAAAKHDAELRQFFQVEPGQFPSLDLILLGIGDDGHTASLFPHTQALHVRDRLITVGNKDDNPRITFTAPFINQAQTVMFIVSGATKQTALAHILAEQGDEQTYPARLIHPVGELWWLLDKSAGEHVSAV